MIDFNALLYDPVYSVLGVTAVITPDGSVGPATVTAIDKTSGVAITEDNIEVRTLRPAAVVRLSELASAGLSLDDLDDGTITLNGSTWVIQSHQERRAPDGSGEAWLFLVETN